MRRALPSFLKLLAVAALVMAVAAPAASAGFEPLSVPQARKQIRVATEMWAGLLDGRAHVGGCRRPKSHLVDCGVVIKSPRTRCEMRVSVKRTTDYDSLRARSVLCAEVRARR